MNVTCLLKKAPIAFLLLFCLAVSFGSAGAERIRLRKVKTHVAPRHIYLSARSGNGVYARRYGYGGPVSQYSTKGTFGKNRRYYAVRNGNGRRRSTSRTYASRYRNWVDEHRGGKNEPRIDGAGHRKKRKELYTFLKEPPLGGPKQKRRNRPNGLAAMQRPRPPNRPNEFDEDYFFPEEAKRAETKYEFDNRFQRPKKKRRPDFEGNYAKIPFYDEKPQTYRTRPREPAFSYSSFVQHPSGSSAFGEDAYEDTENFYSQPVRNKKKRVKKKSNSKKKNKEQFKPFVFENDQAVDSYPPYLGTDEYELPAKTYKKRNKPNYAAEEDDEDFVPSSSYAKPRPQVNGLFSTDSDYRGSQNNYQSAQLNPSYSQTWSQVVTTTTARPLQQYQMDGGFQPQYSPAQYNYNYNKDYSALQKTKTATTNAQQPTYYSQPDGGYRSIPYSAQISGGQAQAPSNYVSFSGQPSVSSTLGDITIQKSVPIYDNTETFYNFNNNAYVNSQSSKYFGGGVGEKNHDADAGQNYGGRLSTYRSKVGEQTDSDSEFIKKHQNLYNKGLTGVPVQGDGYAKETVKKDYDIGYGDFQFDENPGS